jgi:hypothetical protein
MGNDVGKALEGFNSALDSVSVFAPPSLGDDAFVPRDSDLLLAFKACALSSLAYSSGEYELALSDVLSVVNHRDWIGIEEEDEKMVLAGKFGDPKIVLEQMRTVGCADHGDGLFAGSRACTGVVRDLSPALPGDTLFVAFRGTSSVR